jgi:hypothetical protein
VPGLLRLEVKLPSRAQIARAGEKFRDALAATQELRDALRKTRNTHIRRQVFVTQGGGGYAPLAKSTRDARRRRSGRYALPPITTSLIGVWTGELLENATGRGPLTRDEDTKNGIRLTTRYVPLLVFHGGRKDGSQPARPVFDGPRLERELAQTYARHAKGKLRRG